MEIWKQIPSLQNYEASSLGRIRSLSHWTTSSLGRRRYFPGKILLPVRGSNGRFKITAFINGECTTPTTYELVLEAFVGPRPLGMVARHLDGNLFNNKSSNLAWGTSKENGTDKISHGNSLRGSRNPSAKLTSQDVLQIRARINNGESKTVIARAFNVTDVAIYHISTRKNWKWL